MTTSVEAFAKVEQDLLRDRFAEFERGVLQDNIILCDGKSGVLLAFDGAMIVFCVDNLVNLQRSLQNFAWWGEIPVVLFLVAALGFLVSCHFALMTVVPRIHRGRPDHIFWEAPVFRLPEDQYVRTGCIHRLDRQAPPPPPARRHLQEQVWSLSPCDPDRKDRLPGAGARPASAGRHLMARG